MTICYMCLNAYFQFLNNIICIFTYFFIYTYFQKIQTTLPNNNFTPHCKYPKSSRTLCFCPTRALKAELGIKEMGLLLKKYKRQPMGHKVSLLQNMAHTSKMEKNMLGPPLQPSKIWLPKSSNSFGQTNESPESMIISVIIWHSSSLRASTAVDVKF